MNPITIHQMKARKEKGFSLIETLVALTILATVGLSLSYSMITAIRASRRAERNSVASQLAFRKMEELAQVNPNNLSNANDLTESALTVNGIAYTRVTNVTVNADGSRTVDITASPKNDRYGSPVTYRSSFFLWGTN